MPREKPDAFARVHPAVCLAPGLFVALSSGRREQAGPVRTRQILSEVEYVFDSPEALAVDDLRVLQGLFMLASRPAENVELETAAPRSPEGEALTAGLAVRASLGAPTIAKYFTGGVSAASSAAGYDGSAGGSRAVVEASLARLREVEVATLVDGEETFRSRLLAWTPLSDASYGTERGERTAFALSPALSAHLLVGGEKTRHVRIEAREISALGRSGAVRAIHQRICGFVDPGRSGKVGVGTMLAYAFGETESKDTERRRMGDIRKAMEALGALPGWAVSHDDGDGRRRVYSIRRPPARRAAVQAAEESR